MRITTWVAGSLLVHCFILSCAQNKKGTKSSRVTSDSLSGMSYVVHKAETRGETRAGWLTGKHTFSFNDYYEPDRMNFGALRVLNDDRIDPGTGFGTHPHQNMEIITIPLSGSVAHKDNMGNSGIIRAGDVQMMSAGTGITHSEFNSSKTDTLKLLQIWVLPDRNNVKPRYQQLNGILKNVSPNTFRKVVAPNDSSALFLYQKAVFSIGDFSEGTKREYSIAFPGNGVYVFIIEGSAGINGVILNKRDGAGFWKTDKLVLDVKKNSRILLMDVPMID